jgi:hypothetical protein
MPRVEAYVLIDDQGMVLQVSYADMINILAALNAVDEIAHPTRTEYGKLRTRIIEAFAPTGHDRQPPKNSEGEEP